MALTQVFIITYGGILYLTDSHHYHHGQKPTMVGICHGGNKPLGHDDGGKGDHGGGDNGDIDSADDGDYGRCQVMMLLLS